MNFIDRIFIGELTSTVMCEECANVGNFGIHFNMEQITVTLFLLSFTCNHQQSFIFICDR